MARGKLNLLLLLTTALTATFQILDLDLDLILDLVTVKLNILQTRSKSCHCLCLIFLHFWKIQFQKYSKVYLAQKLNPLKLSLHCSAIFGSIFPVVSSTGGWVVNSLSKFRVSVSLPTAGTNGGVTDPWENIFLWFVMFIIWFVYLFQSFPVDSLEEIVRLETVMVIFAIFAFPNCSKPILGLLFRDGSNIRVVGKTLGNNYWLEAHNDVFHLNQQGSNYLLCLIWNYLKWSKVKS